MDVKTAAIQVLQQAGTALHAKDIAEQIMAAGLWQSDGKTPDATVSARLYSDIKNNGDKSPFVKVGPQTFALRDSTEIPSGAEPVPAVIEEAPKPSVANAGFSFNDCAQKVLEEFGGKNPMALNILRMLCERLSDVTQRVYEGEIHAAGVAVSGIAEIRLLPASPAVESQVGP